MFFRKEVLPLDKPIKKKGSELLPKLKEELLLVESRLEEIDKKINIISQTNERDISDHKKQLIRSQADELFHKNWLEQLINVIIEKRYYLISIGEAESLNLLKKSKKK